MQRLWIATIGDKFESGAFEGLCEAGRFCAGSGIQVQIETIENRCVFPFHGLAMMRNMAILFAQEAEATHLLMIDTDILLTGEGLASMMAVCETAVVPTFDQSRLKTPYELQGARRENGSLEWAIMSCVMFNMETLNRIPFPFFQDFMAINEELYYWTLLRRYGIKCVQIPEAVATLLRPPTPMFSISDKIKMKAIMETNGRFHLEPHYVQS